MATLLNETEESRAQGTGLFGRGPEINLPSTNTEPTETVINVRPADPSADGITGPAVTAEPPAAAGNNNWSKIQKALEAGYSRNEVSTYLQEDLGIAVDEADKQVIESVQDRIKQATDNGYNLEEVRDYLITNRYDGSVIDSAIKASEIPKPHKKFEWDPNTAPEEAKDLTDLYKNVYGKYSTMGKSIGGIFSTEMGIEARREINELNLSISTKLQEQGINAFINPSSGELMMRDENGMEFEVDSSLLNDIYNSKLEIAGGITGAAIGAKKGGDIGAVAGGIVGGIAGNLTGVGLALPEEAATIPIGANVGRGVGSVVGGFVGGMTGSPLGKAADMTINALLLKEKLEGELYLTQMKEAAILDLVGGVVGAGLFKMGGAGLKQVMKAYDFVLAGNTKGAYKALTENMMITDDQAKEIVEQWERHTGTTTPGKNFEEKAIGVISTTQQGSEAFVAYATSKDPEAAMRVVTDIDARAKDLMRLTDNVTDDNIGSIVKEQLGEYTKDVKQFYGQVKNIGSEVIDGTDFRFDYDKLAIEPVMKDIAKKISNPRNKELYLSHAERIAAASEDRTFSGLIELRQAVNDFKHTRTKLNGPDYEALNKVLNRIDSQIGKAVKEYMPDNGKEWLQQWGMAKTEYAKMKQLEVNALYKVINNPRASEKAIQQGFKKYIDSLDPVFTEVMEKLPAKTRAKAEGAIIKQYIDRYTLGYATDKQAVHLPMIADSLKGVKFETPEAKYLYNTINEMGKIFKNDISLSKVSGNLAVPKFQSYLTTDPVVRAKFEIASGVFNFIKTKLPGKMANNMALLKQLEKTLENSMHVKTVDKFIAGIPKEGQAEMRSLVRQLQVEMTKNPPKKQDFVKMYKQTKSGKLTNTDGALGKGVYLVDRVKNPNPASKVIAEEVNMSRMATIQDISSMLGREVTEKEVRTIPNLQEQLVDKGYLGIRVEGKAMLFPETTRGVKTPAKSIPLDDYRIVSRYAPVKEAANTINPGRNDFHYVTSNEEILSVYAKSVGGFKNDFIAPKKAKILDLSDPKIADKVFKDLFNSKMPENAPDLEDLMFDLHEGALNARQPGWTDKLKKYMKDNGYSAHSFNGEEAWLPGILKNKD